MSLHLEWFVWSYTITQPNYMFLYTNGRHRHFSWLRVAAILDLCKLRPNDWPIRLCPFLKWFSIKKYISVPNFMLLTQSAQYCVLTAPLIGHISGMVGLIDVKWKGASVGYWVNYVTLTSDLTHDLDLWFLKVKFQNSCIRGIVIWLMWNKRKQISYSVHEKLSWLIRHLSDGLYIFYSNLWNLSSDIWA